MNANEIVRKALDAAGQAGGSDEIARIAEIGPGEMTFSDGDMAVLVDGFGSPGEALYAIQLAAQHLVSANAT